VAHNYRRESALAGAGQGAGLNMWFVVAAESAAAAEAVLQHIEADTGLVVWRFPKEREFKVDLKLPIAGGVDGPV
jgi:hypothetical protein